MGLYQPIYRLPNKRNDYTISEIEKKYSDLELSRLILYNNIHNYSFRKYFPERLCSICNKNKVCEKYQLSDVIECEECYAAEKKKNFDYMLLIFAEENLVYEGNCIIENKLHLGNIRSSYLKDELKKLGVTHIFMVGYYMTPIFPDEFTYGNIEIDDNQHENILQYLIEGIRFIESSQVCFCHCQIGKSRSAAFVMAYVMYKYKMHFSKAFDFVRNKRRIAFPNEGFQCQLEDLDIIMSNFDYDLDKCDAFIKNYFEKRESLKESEKDYLEKRFIEKINENNNSGSDDSNENKNEEEEKNDALNDNEKKESNEKNNDVPNKEEQNENNNDTNKTEEDKLEKKEEKEVKEEKEEKGEKEEIKNKNDINNEIVIDGSNGEDEKKEEKMKEENI
jgi:hypothetical protein